jgi:glycosyltransferase
LVKRQQMKISIITATYNSEQTILDCIASVNSQTYPDIEHIIIDGDSKDDTVKLINSQPNRVTKLVSEPDKSIYDAMNKGISLSTGDIIGFLHSDDFFESKDVLSRVAKAFEKSGAKIVYGNILYVDRINPNKIIRTWLSNSFHYENLRKGWMPAHTTFYAKRELYKKYGLYDTSFQISADYDLMLRFLGLHNASSYFLNITFLRMRYGGASNKFSNYIQRRKEDYRAIRKNNIGGVNTLFLKNVRKLGQFFNKNK